MSPGRTPDGWWTWPGSNRRPPACKAGALPAELHAQSSANHSRTFSIFLQLLPHGAVQKLSQFTRAPTPHFFSFSATCGFHSNQNVVKRCSSSTLRLWLNMKEKDQFASYPSLRERVVLITGGATGIGAAIVEEFAFQGSRVAFLDIDVNASSRLIADLSTRCSHIPVFLACDLPDIAALRAAVAQVEAIHAV